MPQKLNYSKAIEKCEPGSSRTIFDGPGQHVSFDPAKIKLRLDQLLIRDMPADDSMRGSIVIPEIAQRDGLGKNGLFRLGVVVAAGPGDKFSEHGLDAQGVLRRRLLTKPCEQCGPEGRNTPGLYMGFGCMMCGGFGPIRGSGRVPVVVPPQCGVGDTVIYDRRRECEIYIDGVRYSIVHAEQAVIAVVEGEV